MGTWRRREARPTPATPSRLKSRSVTGVTYTYTYAGDNTMLKRTNADGSWTVYTAGVYKNSNGSVVKYYSALGKTTTMRARRARCTTCSPTI